jgi:hypothetical protein
MGIEIIEAGVEHLLSAADTEEKPELLSTGS